MLPFLLSASMMAVGAAVAASDKKKKKVGTFTYPNKVSKKGTRKLPNAYTLPTPVEVILANKIAEQEKTIQDLSVLYTVIMKKIEQLEKENKYKVTIH